MLTEEQSRCNHHRMNSSMARRNDHTREELQSMAIDATRTLIAQQGIEGVSARKVAQQIGYTVGTLYQSFENINDLVLHANAFTLSEMLAELEVSYATGRDPMQRMVKLAEAYLHFAETHQHQWAAVFRHSLPEGYVMPDWYQARIDALFSLIETGIRALSPKRSRQSIQGASRTLWSGVHGICILHTGDKLFSDNIASARSLMQSLVKHYLSSWVAEGKR